MDLLVWTFRFFSTLLLLAMVFRIPGAYLLWFMTGKHCLSILVWIGISATSRLPKTPTGKLRSFITRLARQRYDHLQLLFEFCPRRDLSRRSLSGICSGYSARFVHTPGSLSRRSSKIETATIYTLDRIFAGRQLGYLPTSPSWPDSLFHTLLQPCLSLPHRKALRFGL